MTDNPILAHLREKVAARISGAIPLVAHPVIDCYALADAALRGILEGLEEIKAALREKTDD